MTELTALAKKKLIIALDGVSASGKGSVAKLIAKEFNLAYLETGLLYRAVGYFMLKSKLTISQTKELVDIAKNIELDNLQAIDLQNEIVAQAAAKVAKVKEVREALLFKQKDFANNPPFNKSGAILDGRDIGTVICPNANLKFFLTAELEIRAQRRFAQLKGNNARITLEEIKEALKARDENDKALNNLALNNKDYIIVDNSEFSLQQTFILLKEYIITKCKI